MNASTPPIQWTSQLATGHHDVDGQHQQLFSMLNALAEQRRAGSDEAHLRQMLSELHAYTRYHFRMEEDLMAQWPVNAEKHAAHLRAHRSFIDYLNKAESMLAANVADTLDHLLAFLVKWLMHHISGVDARLVRELASLGMSLNAPPEEISPEEERKIQDMLIDTVSDLHDAISMRTLELLDANRRLLEQMRERERAEQNLRSSEARYRALTDNGQALIWMCNARGEADYFNRPWLNFTGSNSKAQAGQGWLAGVHPDHHARVQQGIRAALRAHGHFSLLFKMQRGDAVFRWLLCEGSPRADAEGNFAGLVGHCLDVTEYRDAENQQRLAAQVFETMSEAVMVTDTRGKIERVNAAFSRITGYKEAEVIGRTPNLLASGRHDASFHQAMWDELIRCGKWSGEVWNRLRNGVVLPMWQRVSTLCDESGLATHYVAVLSDLSEVRKAQELADQLSWRDTLTGLGNRALFMKQLTQAIANAERDQSSGAVLLLDIDRFTIVNDARGLATGDKVLAQVAQSLVGALHGGDIVARLEADEYAILLGLLSDGRSEAARIALKVAERLRTVLSEGVHCDGEKFSFACSIGIMVFPELSSPQAADVIHNANLGMRQAKSAGGDRVQFFESSVGALVREQYELEHELRKALSEGELRVYLQSQIGAGRKVVGAEALIRWQHPRRGLLAPTTFVPVAESSKLIVELDRWVLTQACYLLTELDARGSSACISVNISAQHFQQADFVEKISAIVRRSGADGHHLVLEITESLLIRDINDAVVKMEQLHSLGIRFSLDDFGTGYSSLSYLKRLPIHELKIDRSFVRDITSDSNDEALVDTILSVARHMELQVVAEGVETVEQAAFLEARGPIIHQGYLYGRPEPCDAWLVRYLASAGLPDSALRPKGRAKLPHTSGP